MNNDSPMPDSFKPVDCSSEQLLRDLQLRQVELEFKLIELEVQNEHLRNVQSEHEESKWYYADLYNNAPVGYLTLTDNELISEVNLTATKLFGIDRQDLLSRRFASLITAQDSDRWYLFHRELKNNKQQRNIVLSLKGSRNTEVSVQLDCLPMYSVLRITLNVVKTTKRLIPYDALSARVEEENILNDVALRQHTQEEFEYQLLKDLFQVRTTELDRLNKRFYATFESAPIGIAYLSPQGVCQESNQCFCDFIGYSKAELNLLTFEQFIHSEHHQMLAGKITECMADKISEFTLENKYLHKDGTIICGNTSLKLIRHDEGTLNYFVLIVADISQVKTAKDDLRNMEALNFVLNNSPVLMGYWDKHLKNRFSNSAYSRWFDKTPLQIKGQHIGQTIGEQLYSENLPRINAVMQGETQQFERHILSPESNKTIHTQLSYLPHIINEQVEGFYVLGIDITDKIELCESRIQNRAIFDSLNQGIIITDANRKVIYTNRTIRQLTGYSVEEMLSQSCSFLQGKNTDPQQILLMKESLSQCKAFQGEVINYRKDGSEFWNELTISPIFDTHGNLVQFVGFQNDITERKLIENERKFLLNIIDETYDFVAAADNQGRIIFINRAGLKMVGLPENTNVSGLFIKEFHPEASARRILEEVLPTAIQKGFWVGDSVLLHSDGHEIPVSQLIQVHHQDSPDTFMFFSTIMRDMTLAKRAEAELIEAKTKAENLAQAKADFLANMSHEIRTPMSAILGFSQLAMCKDFPPEAIAYLGKINTAATNLLGTLNNILELSKSEAGGICINPAPFALTDLQIMLNNLFSDMADNKGLNLAFTIAPDVPINVIGDKFRIGQILINLLGNAVKFTDSGSIDFGITLKYIEHDFVQLLFSVTDTGIGLAPNDIVKLFKPFSQVDDSITRRFGGTGLGLVLSDRLVKLMGSEISVVSTLGVGSQFSFALQLEFPSTSILSKASEQNELVATAMNTIGRQFVGIRILVAEDNMFNQQVISEFLNLWGISVEIVNNGEELLEELEVATFDLVLMDIQMPVMGGIKACWHIRRQARFATLPIVAMSAGITQKEQENYIGVGMNDFISKPINHAQLLSTLVHWLKLGVTEDGIPKTPEKVSEQSVSMVYANNVSGQDLPAPLQGIAIYKNEPDTRLDQNILIDLIGDDPMFIAEFMRSFHKTGLETNAEIKAAVIAGQHLKASNASHKLRSSAGFVGAVRLADLCAQLEEAGKVDDKTTLFKLLSQLEKEWAVVEKQLLAWPTKNH
jgi:PAS domain S-box-containing protein